MIVLFVCFFKKLACKAYKIYNFFPTNECFSNEYSCTLAEVSYHLRVIKGLSPWSNSACGTSKLLDLSLRL